MSAMERSKNSRKIWQSENSTDTGGVTLSFWSFDITLLPLCEAPISCAMFSRFIFRGQLSGTKGTFSFEKSFLPDVPARDGYREGNGALCIRSGGLDNNRKARPRY